MPSSDYKVQALANSIYRLAVIIAAIRDQKDNETLLPIKELINLVKEDYKEGPFNEQLINNLRRAAIELNKSEPTSFEVSGVKNTDSIKKNSKVILLKLIELQKNIIYKYSRKPRPILNLLKNPESNNDEIITLIYKTIDGFDIQELETVPYPYDDTDINYLNIVRLDMVSLAVSLEALKNGASIESKPTPCYFDNNGIREWFLIHQNNDNQTTNIFVPTAEFSSQLLSQINSLKLFKENSQSLKLGALNSNDSGPVVNDLITRIIDGERLDDNTFDRYNKFEVANIRSNDLKPNPLQKNVPDLESPIKNPISDNVKNYVSKNSIFHQLKQIIDKEAIPKFKQKSSDIFGLTIINSGNIYRRSFLSEDLKDDNFITTIRETKFTLKDEEKRLAGGFIKSQTNSDELIKDTLFKISQAIVEAANSVNSQKPDSSKMITPKDIARALTFAYKKGGLSNEKVTQEMRIANEISDLMYDFSNSFQEIIQRDAIIFSAQDHKTALRTKRIGDIFGGSKAISKLCSFITRDDNGAGVIPGEEKLSINQTSEFENFIDQTASVQILKYIPAVRIRNPNLQQGQVVQKK